MPNNHRIPPISNLPMPAPAPSTTVPTPSMSLLAPSMSLPAPMSALTPVSIPTIPPFTGPNPLATGSRQNTSGIPSNMAIPIFRPFQPLRSQLSSTSEENRKKSIARMNTTEPKCKGQRAPRSRNEVPVLPTPVTNVAILLFPINVWYSSFLSTLHPCYHTDPPFRLVNVLPQLNT